jgi:RHS repeat-associated protein
MAKVYFHEDRLGSTEYITDDFGGNVLACNSYDPWGAPSGNATVMLGMRSVSLVSEYTGHPYDPVLGMYFAEARMYDAADRRFAAMDPVKGTVRQPATLAQYAYVQDNPLNWVDPLGLLRKAGFYSINGEYRWYDDPDAAEFGADSHTYKILLDTAARIDYLNMPVIYRTTVTLVDNEWAEVAMDRQYYEKLECRVRTNARAGTENEYRQDEIMDVLHKNADFFLEEQRKMREGFSGLMFAFSGRSELSVLAGALIGMAFNDEWGNYKENDHWRVRYNYYEGNYMDADNNRNWREWMYFDGMLIAADDVGNMNLSYVGARAYLPIPLYQNPATTDNKDAFWIQYGMDMANQGR